MLRVKARGQRDLVTVVGHAAAVSAGEFISATGWWTTDRNHGLQVKAQSVTTTTQHYAMLARNLLYTGVTRGKRLVVLVGQRKALAMAVRNNGGRRRWSKLREWLQPRAAGHGTLGQGRTHG